MQKNERDQGPFGTRRLKKALREPSYLADHQGHTYSLQVRTKGRFYSRRHDFWFSKALLCPPLLCIMQNKFCFICKNFIAFGSAFQPRIRFFKIHYYVADYHLAGSASSSLGPACGSSWEIQKNIITIDVNFHRRKYSYHHPAALQDSLLGQSIKTPWRASRLQGVSVLPQGFAFCCLQWSAAGRT
ncbi:hypothetical protein CEXT_762711 [Caerostris extrusa]|uniref:Uncharacterized protein n=1 Tax=Caerostris extrusa TaxID=172846 RepID=A0AAV4S9R7_CAEEX|nr:hypothetical protein CEXT_762711 [Caerostris extrusa]